MAGRGGVCRAARSVRRLGAAAAHRACREAGPRAPQIAATFRAGRRMEVTCKGCGASTGLTTPRRIPGAAWACSTPSSYVSFDESDMSAPRVHEAASRSSMAVAPQIEPSIDPAGRAAGCIRTRIELTKEVL